MNVFGGFRIALTALSANRLRSSLTVLGLVIGIAAVITLMSIGRGAESTVTSYIEDLGTNLIFVQPSANVNEGVRGSTGTGSTLTMDDARALEDSFGTSAISMIAPEKSTSAQVIAQGENYARAHPRTGNPPKDRERSKALCFQNSATLHSQVLVAVRLRPSRREPESSD